MEGAWIKPTGEIIKTGLEWGHAKYAQRIGKTERELELLGWAKIHVYHEAVVNCEGFTQKQVNTLFNFCLEHNYDTSELGSLIDEHKYCMHFIKGSPSMAKSQD